MAARRLKASQAAWIAVGALTALALFLRLPHIDESLVLDEHYAFAESNVPWPWDVIEHVRDGGENSPPLYFLLAWAAMKLGDPTVLIRLPSLLLSTATVPVVYILGLRTVGRRAGLIAAAVVALSPFSIFYSSEARPYATLMFLVACSTLVLLIALERNSRWWWGLYALIACAVLYTHYFGAFALLAQGGWAFFARSERRRELVLANVGVAVGFVPWLIVWLDQQGNSISELATYWPLGLEEVGRELLRLVAGNPMVMPGAVPGVVAIVLAGVGIAVAVAWRAAGGVPKPTSEQVLILLLAVTPVIGFVAYSELGPGIVIARYMSSALPAIALLIGLALAAPPRPVSLAASSAVLAGLAIGAIASLAPEHRRPPWRDVAHYIDRTARSGDVVVEGDCGAKVTKSCIPWARNKDLEIEFERPHETSLLPGPTFANLPPGRRAITAGTTTGFFRARTPSEADGLCLIHDKEFAGPQELVVSIYAPADSSTTLAARGGRDRIALPSGPLPVARGAAKGHVDAVRRSAGSMTVDGWAVGRSGKAAGCVLAFMGGRLVASARASIERPDIERIYGPDAVVSGFTLTVPGGRDGQAAQPSQLRVFAVADGAAAELSTPGEA